MCEAHSSHKEMNNPYKTSSLKPWRDANVSEHMLRRHVLHLPLYKELRQAEPVNEFTYFHCPIAQWTITDTKRKLCLGK